MKILMTGATGLIGKELGQTLAKSGHEITVLSRNTEKAKAELPFPAKVFKWTGDRGEIPLEALKDIEAVINLAGESIGAGRWTSKSKKLIYDSRIEGTRNLVKAIKKLHEDGNLKIKDFISASAIGIYGDRGDTLLHENASHGTDYLAKVCEDWEKEANVLSGMNIRVVNPRIGIVLSQYGGALDKLLPLFTNGIGSAVGSGNQWMSWIHHQDLVRLFQHVLENKSITGPVNAVAPDPVTNVVFSKILARTLNKRLFPKVPSLVLKIALGEMSTLVLSSQRVSCEKALQSGFTFNYPRIEEAFKEITTYIRDGYQEYFAEQWVAKTTDEVFPFFTNESNLEKLTPDFLSFKVLGKSTPAIGSGTIIDYRLSLYGLPFYWKTEIQSWEPGNKFVDTQLKGPYKTWHHTHEFIAFSNGTLLRDRVLYSLPMGFLGNLVAGMKVRSDVSEIFSFRRKFISQLFQG